MLLSELIPWQEQEETYAPQINATIGSPAKPVKRTAFGSLYINQRLGLTDEATVPQIQEKAYMQFFLGYSGYSSKAPFVQSTMVHSRKRSSDDGIRQGPLEVCPSHSRRSPISTVRRRLDRRAFF